MSVSTNLAQNIVDVDVIYVHYKFIFINKRTKNPVVKKWSDFSCLVLNLHAQIESKKKKSNEFLALYSTASRTTLSQTDSHVVSHAMLL